MKASLTYDGYERTYDVDAGDLSSDSDIIRATESASNLSLDGFFVDKTSMKDGVVKVRPPAIFG